MNVESLIEVKKNPRIPDLTPGDTVRVYTRVVEAGKERLQPFQGVVIKVKRGGISASFTVRRIAYGVGVERTFPLYSPRVERVDVIRHGRVRRAKLYYLRGRSGKAARLKERREEKEIGLSLTQAAGVEVAEEIEAAPETEPEAEMAQEEPEEATAELTPEEEAEEKKPSAEAEEAAPSMQAEEPAGETEAAEEAEPAAEAEAEEKES
jgi:large subunit ribosomal protein L19